MHFMCNEYFQKKKKRFVLFKKASVHKNKCQTFVIYLKSPERLLQPEVMLVSKFKEKVTFLCKTYFLFLTFRGLAKINTSVCLHTGMLQRTKGTLNRTGPLKNGVECEFCSSPSMRFPTLVYLSRECINDLFVHANDIIPVSTVD